MKKLIQSCDNDLVFLDIAADSLAETVAVMLDGLVDKGWLDANHLSVVKANLLDRERLSASAIGRSLAIPHTYLECLEQPLIAIGRLKKGLNTGAPDGQPTRFVFVLLGPTNATAEHLDSLANIARLLSDDEFRYLAIKAQNASELKLAIQDRMGGQAVAGPRAAVGAGLQYTGVLFGGISRDIRSRLPFYVSDFVDGMHGKCLGATLFLYFACLAPAIIFGGLMDGATGGSIGAVEMIVATAFCGLVYALIAGQPLIILGGTGPMLVFTAILYQYCQQNSIDFFLAYAWVGFWTGLILVILAITDASCLMRFFTRFTDEIFAALISVIFVYEAIDKLVEIFHRAGHEPSTGYDVAFFSLILALGTFYVASSLSAFRKSHLLVPIAREFLADFGPTIAIISMAAIAFYWHGIVDWDPLPAPDHFQTSTGRDWLVPFMDASPSLIFLTIIPAILCSVLVFLDQNITARLVNSSDNNLKKGDAYHWDLAIVGVLVAICSAFGLPWLVAATVRSLNHLRSLATTEEVVQKSGSAQTHILHVLENRVTGIAIHALIGLSLLLLPFLMYIPLAVLFGLFLYMGIVSMKGNQFFERMGLWATDPALYPRTHFVRRVPKRVMHVFTAVQLICLVVLWIVKTSAWGMLFPLFIAILVPIRFLLPNLFEPQYLAILDADEDPQEEAETWS